MLCRKTTAGKNGFTGGTAVSAASSVLARSVEHGDKFNGAWGQGHSSMGTRSLEHGDKVTGARGQGQVLVVRNIDNNKNPYDMRLSSHARSVYSQNTSQRTCQKVSTKSLSFSPRKCYCQRFQGKVFDTCLCPVKKLIHR